MLLQEQLEQLQFHHLFSTSAILPTYFIKALWRKSHPVFPFPLRSASVPITSYIDAHLTNQNSRCLYCAVMCKKQIKAFCESHCWFHFYMMWYSVFAQAVLTDRMEYCIFTLNNWSYQTLVDYSFELDLLLKRESVSDKHATYALLCWENFLSDDRGTSSAEWSADWSCAHHCPILQLPPAYLLAADSQGGPLWVVLRAAGMNQLFKMCELLSKIWKNVTWGSRRSGYIY